MSINELIDKLNGVWKVDGCNGFSVIDKDQYECYGFEGENEDDMSGCIGIDYDYCSDEMDNSDELISWLYDDVDGGWMSIRKWMSDNGYEEIDCNDGSGNGLFYGGTLFRK